MITVHRDPAYADALRFYNIVIDGQMVGKIKRGESIQVPAPSPGPHQIWVTIDWCRSNKLPFTYENTPLAFECGSSIKGLRVWLAIFYLFLPTKWCWIRQV